MLDNMNILYYILCQDLLKRNGIDHWLKGLRLTGGCAIEMP